MAAACANLLFGPTTKLPKSIALFQACIPHPFQIDILGRIAGGSLRRWLRCHRCQRWRCHDRRSVVHRMAVDHLPAAPRARCRCFHREAHLAQHHALFRRQFIPHQILEIALHPPLLEIRRQSNHRVILLHLQETRAVKKTLETLATKLALEAIAHAKP